MAAPITVTGLKEARLNLFRLSQDVGVSVTRAALLEASLVITRAIKAATYTTFTRRDGRIKAGFGVRVGQEPKDQVITAVVVQYPKPGSTGPRLKSAIKRERAGVAFWWKFLEFGTKTRKSVRTPKTRLTKNLRSGTRSAKAWSRWQSAPSRGGLAARPWVKPSFLASADTALDRFSTSFRQGIEKEVEKLPK